MDGKLRITRRMAREIDLAAGEDYHIPGIVLMENAARGAAGLALEMLEGRGGDGPVDALILCGGGNNGGDGLAMARHLHNFGLRVEVLHTIDPARYRGDALINLHIATAMDLVRGTASGAKIEECGARLIVDAIFGTGLSEAPREGFEEIVAAIERSGARVLAVDLPSGMDCDSGEVLGRACVRADRTITFVAEKIGFANPKSRRFTGEITVGDIGCPRELVGGPSA